MIRKVILYLAGMIGGIFGVFGQGNLTPQQILNKTSEAISNSKGVEANFTVTSSGYSSKGSIKTMGTKFQVSLPDVKVWFNGKDMYTYNDGTEETTVMVPTVEELSESNPLAYVTNASKTYKASFSTVKKTGCYVLELVPIKKNNEVKRITLTVRKTDYVPERIVIEPVGSAPVRADIASFKKGVSFTASEFEYPKSKYPKAEIVDLR